MQNYYYQNKETIKFTLSLILISLSANLMFVTDRAILGLYSIDSMNAVGLGGNFLAMMSFLVTCIAQTATVFVGQYNGKGEYKKTAWASWQMVYLGIFSFAIFIPLAFGCRYLDLFPEYCASEGIAYTEIVFFFEGFYVISTALSTFFIGREKSTIVIIVFILGDIVNAILDYILVLGIPGIIEPQGARGTALATIGVCAVFVLVFFYAFLSKKNREKFGTADFKFRKKLFWDCIKVGLPVSFGKFLNLLGWFLVMNFFTKASRDLATLESFVMSMWMLFIFFADGMSRAISALAANLIGQKNLEAIKKLFWHFIEANAVICALYSIPLVFWQDGTIHVLMQCGEDISHLIPDIKFLLVSLWLILVFDSFNYSLAGLLAAGGDTRFAMILTTCTLYFMVVIPVGVMYYTETLKSIRLAYILIPLTGVVDAAGLYFCRYRKLTWYNQLVDTSDENVSLF